MDYSYIKYRLILVTINFLSYVLIIVKKSANIPEQTVNRYQCMEAQQIHPRESYESSP